MTNKASLVITSISRPNPVLASFAEGCLNHDVDFIVIGDVKSPSDFILSGCDFVNIERQRSLNFSLAKTLPEAHYARKNLGYLLAMERGAEVIIETDDDNFPYDDFWLERIPLQSAKLAENVQWVNIYRYFTDVAIWPRGYPLEYIRHPDISIDSFPFVESYCPIQQGLADDNPDVDAIYRLVNPLPVRFSKAPRIAVGKSGWTPFNSQNTTWFKEVFPLLYIPSYCNFRMCDIWRSFVALRICHENAWNVLFHGPTVRQERNVHNLMEDFAGELPGYLHNTMICANLDKLVIKPGAHHIAENMINCYGMLIDMGVVGKKELALLNNWIDDIANQRLNV
ncbi:MAG: hypothetical protein WA610_08980 [Thermodesulfovibrionales bacterium]